MDLITAENLKASLSKSASLVHIPADARAIQVAGGWVMHCGPYVLRSARKSEARIFRTLDALANAAKECGIDTIQVEIRDD